MSSLSLAVKALIKDLTELNIKYAFVGALALGARGRTRQTIDADVAISFSANENAQKLVDQLVLKGYGINNIYKDKDSIVLARLFSANEESQLVELDFLFELCGIENEVVATAEVMEIWPTLFAPIASMPSLLAMKARCQELPERIQDKADLVNQLIPFATEKDISEARELIILMEQRGFNEGRDLLKNFDYLVQTTLIRK
jgi:hypothetical protein